MCRRLVTYLAAFGILSGALAACRGRASAEDPRAGPERFLPTTVGQGMPPTYRMALVVGIGDYDQWPALPNSRADAEGVGRVLKERFGFEVIYRTGRLTKQDLCSILCELKEKLDPGMEGTGGMEATSFLFYYTGHGYYDDQKTNQYFLIPSDGSSPSQGPQPRESWLDVAKDLVPAIHWLDADDHPFPPHHTLMILDCCESGRLLQEAQFLKGLQSLSFKKLSWGEPAADSTILEQDLRAPVFEVVTAGKGGVPADISLLP